MTKLSFKQIALISLVFHILAAIFSSGFHHFDEHFQIYEFLNLKLGGTEPKNLPWEYHRQIRPWFQVFVYHSFYQFFALLGIKSPFLIAFIFRLLTSLFGWWSLQKFLPLIKEWFTEEKMQRLAFALFNLAWFVPYIQTRTSSESFGISFFLLGFVCFWKAVNQEKLFKHAFLAGLLFGISYLSRSQMSFMVAFLWFWALFIKRTSWQNLFASAFAIIIAIAAGVLFDYWGYGNWTFSTWNYFATNFLEGTLARVKQYPWYWYLRWFAIRGIPPVSLFLLAAGIWGWIKYWRHPLTWATLPLFAFHSYVGHKELRYLFPIIIFAPIYLAFFIQDHREKLNSLWEKRSFRGLIKFTLVINFLFLTISSLRPANPSVKFYQYIYGQDQIKKFYAVGESPFSMLGLPIEFYRRPGLVVEVIPTFEQVPKDKPYYVFFNRGHHIFKMETNNQCQNIYMSYPRWSLNINIGNWISRSRVWSLYRCVSTR